MKISWISGILIVVVAFVISGTMFSVSADCPCKNKDFSSVPQQTQTGTLPEPSSEQSTGILSAGNMPVNNSFTHSSSEVQGTTFQVPPLSSETGSYQILSDTMVPASGCIPSVIGINSASEADPWPAPIITSLYPASVIAGSGSCILTVDGNYFIPETRIRWDARDHTKAYLSPYQMTAEIPAYELGTPGIHYVQVFNPNPCGGESNIFQFEIRDSGQSFPLFTSPLQVRLIPGHSVKASVLVRNPPKGLLRYNVTLKKDPGSPFSFSFEEFPSWVSTPQVTVLNENQMMITGSDENDRITNTTTEAVLVNLTAYGFGTGTGSLQCILNEATADDGTQYGNGYTTLPVISMDLKSFPIPSGGYFPIPTDTNGDRLYEDINGNNRFDLSDITIFFSNMSFVVTTQPWWLFDFDQNGFINLNDVVSLFSEA